MDSPSSRFDDQEGGDEYQSAEEAMEFSPDSDSEGVDLELDSMTGKGINRLFSELLELKKTSYEDFQKNIYSNYSAFLGVFEEVGDIESEITKMKNHVSTQKILVGELMNSFHSEIIFNKLANVKDECVEDLDLDCPSWLETRMQYILETLEVLMSELRLEEALAVLEKETQALQKLQKEKDGFFQTIGSFALAISDWRTRLSEQFASLAKHKRVTWPELHNLLFGLCRLGDSDRASALLLNFFHLQLESSVNELECSVSFVNGIHMLELTKAVFSTIFQAARGFVMLFGVASPYTSDLMQWARVELVLIYHNFDKYVKSFPETSFALDLAVETVNISFSFCSLLEHEGLSLQSDLIKLMKPCITEVMRMHFDQLGKVVSLLASADSWVMGEFSISEKVKNNSLLQEIKEKSEYLQLSSSGRKFIALILMVFDDAFPFQAFHVENILLKGLNHLFDEYIINLESEIAKKGKECDFYLTTAAQNFQQQISIVVDSFLMVYLLPTVVQNSFNAILFSNDVAEQDKVSLQKEMDLWKQQAVEEVPDRIKGCFCEIFVSGIMKRAKSEFIKDLDTCSCLHCIPGSLEDPMPSFVFQELFVLLSHLEEHFGSMVLVKDGIMNSLLNGIMIAMIFWLSENWEFYESTNSYKQLLLDLHFLMETARVGGYSTDNLVVVTLDLVSIMERKLSTEEFHMSSEVPEEGWALSTAKLAIKTLLQAKKTNIESKDNEDNNEETQEWMDGSKIDGEYSMEESSTRLKTQNSISQPLQNPITGPADNDSGYYGNEGSIDSDRLSRTVSVESRFEDYITISGEESQTDFDLSPAPTLKSDRAEIQLFGSARRRHRSDDVTLFAVSDEESFTRVSPLPALRAKSATETRRHLGETEDSFLYGGSNGEGNQVSKSKVQRHAKERVSANRGQERPKHVNADNGLDRFNHFKGTERIKKNGMAEDVMGKNKYGRTARRPQWQ